jgi:ATP-dependent protease HslVU (ClpYQ) peptidase subunit
MPNANGSGRVVNLDEIGQEYVGEVVLKGKTYKVRQMDGLGYQMAAQAGEGSDAITMMYKVAGRCLPDMPEDVVLSLTMKQVEAVSQLAARVVHEVEESAGNPSKAGAKRRRAAPPPA